MKTRRLGPLDVSAVGLGCMSMTPIYGDPDPSSGHFEVQVFWSLTTP